MTIQFIEMAYTSDFATADHPHVENWAEATPQPMPRRCCGSMCMAENGAIN